MSERPTRLSCLGRVGIASFGDTAPGSAPSVQVWMVLLAQPGIGLIRLILGELLNERLGAGRDCVR